MADWSLKYEGYIESVSHKYPESNFVTLKSVHGHQLATYRFHHPKPRALLYCFHGLHLSSSIFTHLAKAFHSNEIAVLAFDQEGHGRSLGERGLVTNLEDYCRDCIKFIEQTRELYPAGTPIFLLGLSMGGALSVWTCLKRPELIRGIILFGASLAVDPNFNPLVQKVVSLLDNCCCRRLGMMTIDQKLVCRNPHYKDFFEENPEFFSGKLNVQTINAILNGFGRVSREMREVTNSVLLVHGEQDRVASVQTAKDFIRDAKSQDKRILLYPNMYHVVTYEPEFHEILEKCIEWVMERI